MDRVTQLRDSFPELDDNQARMLLVLMYKNMHESYPNATPRAHQKLMDKGTAALCNTPIKRIGELLNSLP